MSWLTAALFKSRGIPTEDEQSYHAKFHARVYICFEIDGLLLAVMQKIRDAETQHMDETAFWGSAIRVRRKAWVIS